MAKQYTIRDNKLHCLKDGINVHDYLAKYPNAKLVKGHPPTVRTMEVWMFNGIAISTDGCRTEPDGTCQHGHQSWLLVLGYI